MKTILINGHDLKFLTHVINYFKNNSQYRVLIDEMPGHEITDTRKSSKLLKDADLVFCEWALGNAEWYSKNLLPGQKLVIRLHHQEINLKYIKAIDYSKVDKIIFICQENLEIFLDRFPHLRSICTLIYNVIDCTGLCQPKTPGADFNLGFIGSSPMRKAPHHALNVFMKLRQNDSRYTLSFKGKHPWEYPWLWKRSEEQAYYRELYGKINNSPFSDAIVFDPHGNDMPHWFSKIGFILSTSDHEGSHQAVAEGMASGSIPVIRNWDGADKIYPERFVVKSENEAVEFIKTMHDRRKYSEAVEFVKLYARENFDIPVITSAYDRLFRSLLGMAPLADATVPLASKLDKPLGVIQICYLKPGSQSGYAVRVIEETKVLGRHGVKVIIAAFISKQGSSDTHTLRSYKDSLEAMTGASVYFFPTSHFFDLETTGALENEIDTPLMKLAEEHGIRILHGQALYSGNHALRVGKKTGLKVVFDNHGVSPEENEMTGETPLRVKRLSDFEKVVLREADLTIMVSDAMQKFYKTKYGLTPRTTQLIPCCVNFEHFRMDEARRSRIRKSKGFHDKFVMLYLGTMSIWQWPEAMFNMFSRFHRAYPNSMMYLLIPEYDHDKARAYIQKCDLPPESYLLEEVEHDEIGGVIGAADAGILLRESHPVNFVSSPTKFGEYLAAGLPVILTEGIGDYSELAVSHNVGITIKIDEESLDEQELKRLLDFVENISSDRKKMAKDCYKLVVNELSWNNHVKQLIDQYNILSNS